MFILANQQTTTIVFFCNQQINRKPPQSAIYSTNHESFQKQTTTWLEAGGYSMTCLGFIGSGSCFFRFSFGLDMGHVVNWFCCVSMSLYEFQMYLKCWRMSIYWMYLYWYVLVSFILVRCCDLVFFFAFGKHESKIRKEWQQENRKKSPSILSYRYFCKEIYHNDIVVLPKLPISCRAWKASPILFTLWPPRMSFSLFAVTAVTCVLSFKRKVDVLGSSPEKMLYFCSSLTILGN